MPRLRRKAQHMMSQDSHPKTTEISIQDHSSVSTNSTAICCTSIVQARSMLLQTNWNSKPNIKSTATLWRERRSNKIENGWRTESWDMRLQPLIPPKAAKEFPLPSPQLRMSQSSSKAADTTLDAWPHLNAASIPGGFRPTSLFFPLEIDALAPLPAVLVLVLVGADGSASRLPHSMLPGCAA